MEQSIPSNVNERLQKLEKRMDKFSEILEKFGLNLIQSIGGLKHDLSVVSEKIEKIEKSMIDLKGIKTQLYENAKIQREWNKTTGNIQAQIRSLNQKLVVEGNHAIVESQPYPHKSESPDEVLEILHQKLLEAKTQQQLYTAIHSAREDIFVLTGGHPLLFELKTYEQKLKNNEFEHFNQIQQTLVSKITEWKDRL